MERLTIDDLIYSDDHAGLMKLFIYEDGYHGGPQWFGRGPSNELIPPRVARRRAEAAIEAGREVRVCNGKDFLVFHAVDGAIVFPADTDGFWRDVGAG